MAKQSRTWWQKYRKLLLVAAVITIVLLAVFALAVSLFGWDWTGFNGGYSKITIHEASKDRELPLARTLWDWLQLLVVPIMLAIGGFWLNQIQKSREDKITERQ